MNGRITSTRSGAAAPRCPVAAGACIDLTFDGSERGADRSMSDCRHDAARGRWERRQAQRMFSGLIEERRKERSLLIKTTAFGIVATLYGLYFAWAGDRNAGLEAAVVLLPLALTGVGIRNAIECHRLLRSYQLKKAGVDERPREIE